MALPDFVYGAKGPRYWNPSPLGLLVIVALARDRSENPFIAF
jgi:hypothetical protein